MDINYNIVSLIDMLGLIQGIILGTLMLFINKNKVKSTIYLGLFILAYSLDFLPAILEDLHILKHYSKLILFPLDFTWLLFPLFYIYVQKVSIFSSGKISYWVLYPGILSIVVNIILFLLPVSKKILIEDSVWYGLYILAGILYSLWIGFLTVKWINKHINEVKNQFALVEFKELRWARLFVVIGLTYLIVFILISILFYESFFLSIVVSTINVLLLYWISVRGILQQNVHTLVPISEKSVKKGIATKDNEETIASKNENVKALLQKLEDYIVNENAFTKTDLTIIDVSKKINEHPKRISGAINSQLNQNFNSYINNFRVKKAKELLNGKLANNFSIEGIGHEVGFQSKSTFYDAFKKATGTTPSRYKNKQ